MTEIEIIQALKKNTSAFELMPEELQEWAKEHCNDMQMYFHGGDWISADPITWVHPRFRLRPDYPEEPEEKIEVKMIRGDGTISPVSTESINAYVKEVDGKKYVSLFALEYAIKSIEHARYWFDKLEVWGNSENVQKIYHLFHPEWYENEKPKWENPEIDPTAAIRQLQLACDILHRRQK
jgi:hypothetical protein